MSRIARNSALLYTKSSVRICSLQVSALTVLRGLNNEPVANDFGDSIDTVLKGHEQPSKPYEQKSHYPKELIIMHVMGR